MDDIFFDETELIEDIKSKLKQAFNTVEWKKMFGNRKVVFYDSLFIEKPSFPCIYISCVSNNPENNKRTSEQVELYTRFEIEIETYNQEADINGEKVSKEKFAIIFNREIKRVIAEHYRMNLTNARPIPNMDSNICRRMLSYTGIIDNRTKMIYNID